jgi:tight adherence protein B
VVGLGDAWVLALLVFVAVALVTVALSLSFEWIAARNRQRGVSRQLERLATEGLESIAPGAGNLFRRSGDQESRWVTALAARVPHLRDVKYVLQQGGLGWTVQTYLMLVVGLGIAFGTSILVFTGSWIYAIPGVLAGALLPYFYVRHRRKRRLKKFEEHFPGAVDLLGRAIRAGHPFSAGLKMVADESPEPIASEFRQTFEEQRFGLPFEDTLTSLGDRVPLIDVRIFITAIMIQREVGGNLTEILDNLSAIIRQRFTLQRQVQVLTAEGRLSMYVLTALPFGVGLFVFSSNPAYVMTLFEHPIGHMMIGVALVLQVIGFIWMRKITNIEF